MLQVADVVPDERREKDEKHFSVYTIIICSEEEEGEGEREEKIHRYRVVS